MLHYHICEPFDLATMEYQRRRCKLLIFFFQSEYQDKEEISFISRIVFHNNREKKGFVNCFTIILHQKGKTRKIDKEKTEFIENRKKEKKTKNITQ